MKPDAQSRTKTPGAAKTANFSSVRGIGLAARYEDERERMQMENDGTSRLARAPAAVVSRQPPWTRLVTIPMSAPTSSTPQTTAWMAKPGPRLAAALV